MSGAGDFTVLLRQWRGGDRDAGERVVAEAYTELRRLARYYMKQEREGHTLQATALVHEAYLRLCRAKAPDVENHDAFIRLMGAQLKHLLIDHARRRAAVKRGGDRARADLDEVVQGTPAPQDDTAQREALLERLDAAQRRLAADHARVAKVIELRFFADLSIEETAVALGISPGTVKRDYSFGRAWLIHQLEQTEG
jgi:RNA polymerase sigma factor (TIGR02999 family)